jgi:N-methylhydantoinase A
VRFPKLERAAKGSRPPPTGSRHARLDGQTMEIVPTWRRERLLAGHEIDGPAIVDQLDSTTVILSGQRATVDPFGTLVIEEG